MKYLLALLAAVFLIATSGTLIDDGMPPAKYQADRTNVVHYSTRPLPHVCGIIPKGFVLNGCTTTVGRPEVYLPNPCSAEFAGQSFARYACHEMAHSNGWPADHPR